MAGTSPAMTRRGNKPRVHYRERAAHALRQAKKASVSSLPSISSRKSSKLTPTDFAAGNERKKSRTAFGTAPSLRLAQRCAPAAGARAAAGGVAADAPQAEEIVCAAQVFYIAPAQRFRIARGDVIRLAHRLDHSESLSFSPSLSSPGTRVWLRQPEQKLDDPGDPVTADARAYWMPAFAGMTVCCAVSAMQARSFVAAMRLKHPGFVRPPKGWRAEKRRPMASRISERRPRGRLSARHRGDLVDGRGRAFAVSAPQRSFCPVWVPLRLCAQAHRERRSSAFGVSPTVVSQLLAGPHSGPGRSPGAARVLGYEPSPRDTAPHPASRRLMSAPFSGRGGWSVVEARWAGIRISRQRPLGATNRCSTFTQRTL
jgi:hypothetical protein